MSMCGGAFSMAIALLTLVNLLPRFGQKQGTWVIFAIVREDRNDEKMCIILPSLRFLKIPRMSQEFPEYCVCPLA